MARADKAVTRLDAPKGLRTPVLRLGTRNESDTFGRFSEAFARAMGTSGFLIGMTVFVTIWLIWNIAMPRAWQFDPAATNFTLLTLILSLQASYAAPLILLAQNRQDDRDRVQIEQDRQRAERNLADTEYLAREVVALRLAVKDMASKDFIRAELRSLLEELERDRTADAATSEAAEGTARG
ncbi:DUF1003 domain-containing protein [Humibacter ginsenosidimutans]|uniref:DUF1003 domain-containing protein n=1 Tax=Humibacter ginsenosidimutans TaxID=2599293 RepID=A0A5B8M3K9_9MICO|nr:DUF1003 domain-containing protein [Humibacter ginsenosidimutans]QDZ14365.1 DUF1003 domain-containing protein [Humibacter ginsenosidimutans]